MLSPITNFTVWRINYSAIWANQVVENFENRASSTASRGCIAAIDQFRGFAILVMILADYLNNINSIPAWFKHAPDIGYTIIDLVAPLFIFAIGLTYGISFRQRFERFGAWKTHNHFSPGTWRYSAWDSWSLWGECWQITTHLMRIGACCRPWGPRAW